MKERAFKLMKEWCDTLLTYRVSTNTPYTDGALLCPACHVIHGRIADLCFPFTVLWAESGDESYLERADELIDWSEYNLKTFDGLWYNDITNRWYPTSVFSAMSIGEALYHFSDKLPEKYKIKWKGIFSRMAEVIYRFDTRDDFRPVINYFCGTAAFLAMAWRITSDGKYLEKAKYWIDRVLSNFDEDGLLYGEAHPAIIDRGCRAVDMGYNLEESIPLLLRYASLTGDKADYFKARLMDHLEFLLPDGGIDDSFGIRHNKWTYWGSRTSDGVIEGLSLLLDDPVCADACERVLGLYERCTVNGLLAMPMGNDAGEPTCIHHTFTHTKALASLICAENDVTPEKNTLPCEKCYGVKEYQNGNLLLFSNNTFRATFSALSASFHAPHLKNGGSSMNLLYHKKYGIVCAATTAGYEPTEPLNQQYLRKKKNPPCMTAQMVVCGKEACYDNTAVLSHSENVICASGEKWNAEYSFSDEKLNIRLTCENGIYSLPIVCGYKQNVNVLDGGKCVKIDGSVTVISNIPIEVDPDERVFHQVGGLSYVPLRIKVEGSAEIEIS